MNGGVGSCFTLLQFFFFHLLVSFSSVVHILAHCGYIGVGWGVYADAGKSLLFFSVIAIIILYSRLIPRCLFHVLVAYLYILFFID